MNPTDEDELERCEDCGEPTPAHEMVTLFTATEWAENTRLCVPCAERYQF